jgi:hypothetical protein
MHMTKIRTDQREVADILRTAVPIGRYTIVDIAVIANEQAGGDVGVYVPDAIRILIDEGTLVREVGFFTTDNRYVRPHLTRMDLEQAVDSLGSDAAGMHPGDVASNVIFEAGRERGYDPIILRSLVIEPETIRRAVDVYRSIHGEPQDA